MAYSFWGAYNGFANISQNYTRDIFTDNNVKLQNYIDAYLKDYLQTVVGKRVNFLTKEKQNQYDIKKNIVSDMKEEELVLKFFNIYVLNKYKLNIDEFTKVLKINNQKKFQDELKLKHSISKNDSQKLFNVIKKFFDPSNLFQ